MPKKSPIERVHDRYEKRVIQFLNDIRAELVKNGVKTAGEVDSFPSDEYQWGFVVRRPQFPDDVNKGIGVDVIIVESIQRDGEMDDGINFEVRVQTEGGKTPFDYQPSNYTKDCWVDAKDAEAVEARFADAMGVEVGLRAVSVVLEELGDTPDKEDNPFDPESPEGRQWDKSPEFRRKVSGL